MQGIDLNEIAVFLQVVQAGSFTRAAKQLNMPNSTVSARVSSLEKRLGVTLLQRTTRQLSLTQAGRCYYQQCAAGLEEIHKAESGVAANQAEPSGDLRISAPVFLGGVLLPQIIARCRAEFPKISLEVVLKDRSMDLISENIDVAIRAGDLDDSSLVAKRVGTVEFTTFASSAYFRKREAPAHPKDLATHACIQFTPLGKDAWRFTNGKNSVSVPLKGQILVDDMYLVKALTEAGEGIALLPTFICHKEVQKGRLVRALPEWQSVSRRIQLVHLPQRFPSPKLRAFLDIAADEIKNTLGESSARRGDIRGL